jgi:glycosyltransferase A (GT-A) superfamily protein (DUF2064 family)
MLSAGDEPVALVGMDTPQLSADLLSRFDPRRFDACLGLSEDGGFWVIGLRDPRDASKVVPGVPMSTCRTGRIQLQRLHDARLRVQLLPTLIDVDTIEDARQVAEQAPTSRFARAFGLSLAGSSR